MIAPETLGARLRRLREERGLSQRACAGPRCTSAYISRIEAGERIPTVNVLRLLAFKLGVSLELLETGEEAVIVSVAVATIDSDPQNWHPGLAWGDLTPEERRQVTSGLQDALLDSLSARIYAVQLNRENVLAAGDV